jgi:hypothetical protein
VQRLGSDPELLEEAIGYRLDDYEALRRDTALTGIEIARGDGVADRQLQVGILEHDEGIRATQFQHYLLQCCAGACGNLAPCQFAAGQRDRMHARIVDTRAA